MIEYRQGSLLDVKRGIIVHGCNAQGIMGSGIAKNIKEKWPKAYTQYVEDISRGNYKTGDISTYSTAADKLYIISAITQEFYGREPKTKYTSYDAIDNCFNKICWFATQYNMTVHIPKIGAGLGGGAWSIIAGIIMYHAAKTNVKVKCWELTTGDSK